jgi:hypothetical protein
MPKRPAKPAPRPSAAAAPQEGASARYRSMSVYSVMSFSAGELRKATYRGGRPIRPAVSS